MDPKLAVHDRIGVGADLRGADGMAKAAGRAPRKVDHVLTISCLRAGNDFRLAHLVECRLTTQLPRGFDRRYDRVQVVVSAEIVGLDEGVVTPVRACQAHLPATCWLGESRRNGETFFRRRGEPGSSVRSGNRELLEYQGSVDGTVVYSTGQIDLGFNSIAVRGAIDCSYARLSLACLRVWISSAVTASYSFKGDLCVAPLLLT